MCDDVQGTLPGVWFSNAAFPELRALRVSNSPIQNTFACCNKGALTGTLPDVTGGALHNLEARAHLPPASCLLACMGCLDGGAGSAAEHLCVWLNALLLTRGSWGRKGGGRGCRTAHASAPTPKAGLLPGGAGRCLASRERAADAGHEAGAVDMQCCMCVSAAGGAGRG